MNQNRDYSRSDRVSQQVHEIIATLLLRDVKDPRLDDVQVTAVEVSPDLRHATVYYVLLDQREADPEVAEGLERASGFMRKELGDRVQLKYTPELAFEYDESVERGRRIEKLIDDLDIPPEPEDPND